MSWASPGTEGMPPSSRRDRLSWEDAAAFRTRLLPRQTFALRSCSSTSTITCRLLLDEEFTVEVSGIWSEGARLNTEYAAIKSDGRIAATAYTVQMLIDGESGETCLTSPELLERCRERWKAGELSWAAMKAVAVACDLVSPYGWGVDACWEGLLSGRTAIRRFERFSGESFPTEKAGFVEGLDPDRDETLVMQMLRPLIEKNASAIPADALSASRDHERRNRHPGAVRAERGCGCCWESARVPLGEGRRPVRIGRPGDRRLRSLRILQCGCCAGGGDDSRR